MRPILTENCEILNEISEKKLKAIANREKQLEQLYFGSPSEKVHLASQAMQVCLIRQSSWQF